MGWNTAIGLCSGLLILGSYVLYIVATIRKQTKPNRATWFMLATISVVIAATYKDVGAESTLYAAIGSAVGTVAIAILSIWYGTGGWSKLDRFCILIASASLLIYFLSASPLLTLILSLVMDGAALVPTIQHARKTPHEEDRLAWTLTVLGDFLAVVAIDHWTFGVALYPIYMVAINGLVLFYLYRRRAVVR